MYTRSDDTGAERAADIQTVAMTTLGCRSNQYDSSAMEDIIRSTGFGTVPFSSVADVYIINTCTVTRRTDYQSRQLIRRVRRRSPDALVIVTGCYAQVSPDEVAAIEGVDYILGNPEKEMVVECIKRGRPPKPPVAIVGRYENGTPLSLRAGTSHARTRVNLKVQDGCNRSCSYCIIPKARGISKSVPLGDVLKEIDGIVESGYREIVLTGIHLGAYGADLSPRSSITDLVREIDSRGYPCRFRISSLDPDEVTDEFIDLLKGSSTVCNHLHLPLESGDDGILRLMRRPYTARYFADRVKRLHEAVPGISIGADVIVGFPGEGDREFENTFTLLRDLPVSYLHVFPYSRRRGTPAAEYPGQVDARTVKERCLRLHELDRTKRRGFYRRFLGQELSVLVESSRDSRTALLKARTSNYIPVFIDAGDELKRREVLVKLHDVTDGGMLGRV